MRVFTATLATETNTFAPMPTGLSSFYDRGYFKAGTHPDQMTFFAGPLWAARQRSRERGWTLVEGMVAAAQPSGITTREAWQTLRAELLGDLRSAMPVDLVLLGLHGAMVADGCDDCEGELLAAVRGIVGSGAVVAAELDPHSHLTPAMVSHADLLIAFKEYPHTDVFERACELADLGEATVLGRARPVAGVADTGMIAVVHTTREPARSFVDMVRSLEGRDGVLSISLIHGFPWGDVAEMGTKVLVYADGDAAKAAALARRLADELYAMRDLLQPRQPGIDDAIDEAIAARRSPVVIADGADNPGGGAAGDSTFILHRLIERGVAPAALGPLWDPLAVRIAFDAGAGATLALRIGGKVSPMSGDPLDAVCTVRSLRREMQMTGLAGTPVELGDCALVETAGVQVVLSSQRHQAMDADLFTRLGCDLAAQRVIVVKSSQHFYASFSKIAHGVVYAAAPGSVAPDLATLPYRHVRRPRWPLR